MTGCCLFFIIDFNSNIAGFESKLKYLANFHLQGKRINIALGIYQVPIV